MGRLQTATRRHELLLVSATLAAHANTIAKGFRQRDVRRMIEFSASWAYPEFDEGGIPVDNTQIRRYLEWIVTEGFARKLGRGTHPKYQLTRTGIIELVAGVTGRRFYYNWDEFYYLFFIISAYRQRVMAMIEHEGRRFPYALRLEFESLLDTNALISNQLAFAKRELLKLEKRIKEQQQTVEFVKRSIKEQMSYEKLTVEVEKRFPYSLNSALSVSQFLPALTPKQAIWELTVGSIKRCEHIWRPAKETLELHIGQLERLLKAEGVSGPQNLYRFKSSVALNRIVY